MQTSYEDLISVLVSGLGQRALFRSDHPRVLGAAREFAQGLRRRLETDKKRAFFLGVAESRLVHNGTFLFGASLTARRLVQLAERLCCGGFLFPLETEEQDVLAFFDTAVEAREKLDSLALAQTQLAARTAQIQLSPPHGDPGWFGQFMFERTDELATPDAPAAEHELLPVYQSLFETVEKAHDAAGDDSGFDVDSARATTESLLATANGSAPDLLRAVVYPNYDSYTVGHSVRVAMLAIQVGLQLELPREYLIELGAAGLLHDVGKSKVPREILFKPAKLDAEERAVVSTHARIGAELLIANGNASALSIGAAFGHHLRHDHSGYPQLRSWGVQSRATALIQVCDVFEALTAIRPYKSAMTPRAAYEVMLADRDCFDPGALQAFLRAIGLYPPGSRVILTTGERAVVEAAGLDIDRPTLTVTHDARGEAKTPERRNLAQAQWRHIAIRRLIPDTAPQPDLHSLNVC